MGRDNIQVVLLIFRRPTKDGTMCDVKAQVKRVRQDISARARTRATARKTILLRFKSKSTLSKGTLL